MPHWLFWTIAWLFCGGATYNSFRGPNDWKVFVGALIGGPALFVIRMGMLMGALIMGAVYGSDAKVDKEG